MKRWLEVELPIVAQIQTAFSMIVAAGLHELVFLHCDFRLALEQSCFSYQSF